MTMIGKIGKLAIAGTMMLAMTSPSLAQWVVVRVGDQCSVVEESNASGEIRVAGPYGTQHEAEEGKKQHPRCRDDDKSPRLPK